MSSAGFPGGGGGGEKRDDKPALTVAQSALSAAPIFTPGGSIMDIKTLQAIRPKVNPTGVVGQPQPALSAVMQAGNEGGHVGSSVPAGVHGSLPVTVTIPQPNIVQLTTTGSTAVSNTLPLNVIRSSVAARPQFPSHLPRGAVAAASALSKTGPNIATAAAAVVRPPIQIPVSSAIHGASIPPMQNPLGRSPLLSAIKQTTPPSTRSPSPAVNISASQAVIPETHRQGFSLHSQAVPSTTQNIQITLTTTRSTTSIEIPKPVITQQKPLNIPTPMAIQTGTSKVIVSQPVNPLLSHQPLAKTVNLSLAGHTPAVSANPVTLSSITATTTIASAQSTIPIAKVTPQRQQQIVTQSSSTTQSAPVQELSRTEAGGSSTAHPHSQTASSRFLPPHRTTTTTAPVTTAISVPSSTQPDARLESRNVGNIPQLPHLFQQQDSPWSSYSLPYPLVYHPVAAQAQAAQNPLTASISSPATSVRPGMGTIIIPRPQVEQSVPSQNPNLAATLQAQAMTMASPQVRFPNSMMVHPMSAAVHTTFAAAASSTTTGTVLPQQEPKQVISSTVPLCRTPPPMTVHDCHNLTSLSSAATVASSIYNSSPNVQNQNVAPSSGSTINNPSASPRPSILRKRTSEGVNVAVKRPLGLMSDSHSPKPEPPQPQSNTSSPKTPAGDNNSQSSTDTALSSNDATTPTQNSHPDVKIKQEPADGLENGPSTLNSFAASPVCNSVEASPRKRSRKQLLNAAEELKDNTSTDEEVEKIPFKENKTKEIKKEQKEEFNVTEYVDDEGIRWTTEKKRPNVNLMNFYNINWKPKNNHFLKFSDVKPKDERRPTVNELSNQRGIHQRASGWKLYHMASQLENLLDLEKDMCTRISHLRSALAPRPPGKPVVVDDYDGILHELSQANIQRCQLIGDQLEEARSSMMKILEHKPRIVEIINKHMSKRPIKKKERT